MKWLIVGNFSIALISIFISAFVFKESNLLDFDALERRVIIQESEIDELSVTQENLRDALEDKRHLLKEIEVKQDSLSRDVNLRKEVVDKEISSIKEKIKNDPEVVALIQIEQLIRLANQKSLFERNLAAAIMMMKEVSIRLEKNSTMISDFEVIKEAIEADIDLLKESDLVDISVIYKEIGDIMNEIAFSTFTVNKEENLGKDGILDDSQLSVKDSNTDSIFLSVLMSELRKLVEFGKLDDGFKPVFSVKEDYLLKQQVSINLNIAQLSLLRGNNVTFQESLAEAKEILIPYFQFNEELKRIYQDINALNDIIIEKKAPSLSRSLACVRKSIKKVTGVELQ